MSEQELKALRRSLKLLRDDALDRRMDALVIAYGWSLIDAGQHLLSLPNGD